MNQREIKFRAWDLEDKKMRYGFALNRNTVESFLIYKKDSDGLKRMNLFNTLMQYTGLKDKNGKEIYEGDILKHRFGRRELIGVMIFDQTRATFGFNAQIESKNEPPSDHLILKSKPEIIGNIYENPELLK